MLVITSEHAVIDGSTGVIKTDQMQPSIRRDV